MSNNGTQGLIEAIIKPDSQKDGLCKKKLPEGGRDKTKMEG